jgi:hypothetical protein
MSTSIKELIAANVLAAVNAVTTVNLYHQTIVAQRPRRNDWSDVTVDDLNAIIQMSDEIIEGQHVQAVTWLQPFVILVIVMDDDSETDSIETRQNNVDADIKKHLRIDRTRGGYAIETDIMESKKFDLGKGFEGIAINIIVRYRTKVNDPFTQS